MKFDFTPDPKILLALTHTPMQPMDALCELIDNAIDSFYTAKIQGIVETNPMIIVELLSQHFPQSCLAHCLVFGQFHCFRIIVS